MNKNAKYTIAQGIIWAYAMLATAVTLIASGAENLFIVPPILACGAAISIVIQGNSVKNANRSALNNSHSPDRN